jgi:ATP-dependent Clp protease ATP-binding subunit ClpC
LKRQIRQELETRLAKEILNGDLKPGDSVEVSYDKENDEVKFSKSAASPASKATGAKGGSLRAKKKPSKEVSSQEPTESAASKE